MKTIRRQVAVLLIAGIAVLMPIDSALADHGAQFFSHPWLFSSSSPFSVGWYFRDNFPAGAWRDQVRNGFAQWNGRNQNLRWSEGGQLGYYDNARNPCVQPYQRNVAWYDSLDGWGGPSGTNLAALTYWCLRADSTLHAFTMVFDNAETWYTGTGDAPSDQWDAWSIASQESGHAGGFIRDPDHWDGAAGICQNYSGQHTMCPVLYIGTERVRTIETHEITAFEARY